MAPRPSHQHAADLPSLSLTYLFFNNNIFLTMVAEQEWHSFFFAASSDANKKANDKNDKELEGKTGPSSSHSLLSLLQVIRILRCCLHMGSFFTHHLRNLTSSTRTYPHVPVPVAVPLPCVLPSPAAPNTPSSSSASPTATPVPFVATSSAMHWLLSQSVSVLLQGSTSSTSTASSTRPIRPSRH